jgi:integrase/recombinase XerD
MQRYLCVHRPVLLGGTESTALWISQRGNRLSQDSFTSGLALLTERHFGVALRPHAFRHIAATSIAEVDPCHVGIIRDILGHATLDMAERHYNRASAVTAGKRMQSLLRDIQRESDTMSRTSRAGREH